MSTTRVDAGALEALKVQVLRKHGKLRGALKAEVTEAVRDRARKLAEEAPGDG